MKISFIKYEKDERAQAMVEFALILPILVALMMAIFEFGFLLKNYLGLNYAISRGAKEAMMCRGQMNADLKVVRSIIKSCAVIDAASVRIVSPTGEELGPYHLDTEENVLDSQEVQVTFPNELFFYSDGNTPNYSGDDTRVDPSNPALPSYAKIQLRFIHQMINPFVFGYNGGTFILYMNTIVRLPPM